MRIAIAIVVITVVAAASIAIMSTVTYQRTNNHIDNKTLNVQW